MRSQISNQFQKRNVAWNDVNRLPASFQGHSGHHPPKPYPAPLQVKTQAHITFDENKMIKYNWYKNYSKKLCDLGFLVFFFNNRRLKVTWNDVVK